jgi:hypothetical protein
MYKPIVLAFFVSALSIKFWQALARKWHCSIAGFYAALNLENFGSDRFCNI